MDSSQMKECAFEEIDTEDKAYALGWLFGCDVRPEADGFSVSSEHNLSPLSCLSKILNMDALDWIEPRKLMIPSEKVLHDIAGAVKSESLPGIEASLQWAFIRGLVEASDRYEILERNSSAIPEPMCWINVPLNSWSFASEIRKFVQIQCDVTPSGMEFRGSNAIDLLGKMYRDSSATLRSPELYSRYARLANGLTFGKMIPDGFWNVPQFRWTETISGAPKPRKSNSTDSGWDLHLVKKIQDPNFKGNFVKFDTGIAIQPPAGWYTVTFARSSLSKTGWKLVFNGIIDNSYRGSIMVILERTDGAEELPLPFCAVQLVPFRWNDIDWVHVDSLQDTTRGQGGFGSTNEAKRQKVEEQ